MEKKKVGVIGVGHLGRFHAMNYNKIDQAVLVGVYDVDAGRAKEIADEMNCQAFDTMDALLQAVYSKEKKGTEDSIEWMHDY